MFIRLTLYGARISDKPLIIRALSIIGFYPYPDAGTRILTDAGTYDVKETPAQVFALLNIHAGNIGASLERGGEDFNRDVPLAADRLNPQWVAAVEANMLGKGKQDAAT